MWVQSGCNVGAGLGLFVCLSSCPLVAGGAGFRGLQDLPEGSLWSSGGAFPAFCPLSRFAFGGMPANMPLFRILRRFSAGFMLFVWVCLAWVLCVDCGAFCVRVRLGGFGACGVFRFSFSSFLLLSSLFLLSSCSSALFRGLLPFLLSWSLDRLVLWLLAFFPFRTASDTKRKGAKCFCVLSCPVVVVPLLLFGFNP